MSLIPFNGISPNAKASSIVAVLRRFGLNRPIPIGFVAQAIGRLPEEIRESLESLAESEVVRIDEKTDTVSLVRS